MTASTVHSGADASSGRVAPSVATLSVDVSRENATLIHKVVADAPSDADLLWLDGAFGIYVVTESNGFVADGGGFRLETATDRGTLTARLGLSELRETALGTIGPGGAYRAAPGWLFAPSLRLHVRWAGSDGFVHHLRLSDESTATDTVGTINAANGTDASDEGTVTISASTALTFGQRFLFLGPHSIEQRTVEDQLVRFVVPGETEFAVGVNRAAVLLGAVQNETGTRADGPITTFVLPEQSRDGGASSGTDVWVRADVGEVTVAHEYVHASLSLRTTTETRWLREASAEFLAYRLAGESGAIDSLDVTGAHDDATLTDPATWENWRVPYDRGAATLAVLDERLRNATDGEVTVGRLVGELSRASRTIALTHDRFVAAVRDAGGDTVARWVDAVVSKPDSGRRHRPSPRVDAYDNSI